MDLIDLFLTPEMQQAKQLHRIAPPAHGFIRELASREVEAPRGERAMMLGP